MGLLRRGPTTQAAGARADGCEAHAKARSGAHATARGGAHAVARDGANAVAQTNANAANRAADNAARAEKALRRWGDLVFRVALSQLGSRADAEDVCQDVFLRLLRHRGSFSGDEHLKAWLIRVTLNRCRDLQRSASRRHAVPWDDHLDNAPAADPISPRPISGTPLVSAGIDAPGRLFPANEEDAPSLDELTAALPADQRAAVCLHYAEGMPTKEIARMLGCSDGAVRTRLYRAREAIRRQLEGARREGGQLEGSRLEGSRPGDTRRTGGGLR